MDVHGDRVSYWSYRRTGYGSPFIVCWKHAIAGRLTGLLEERKTLLRRKASACRWRALGFPHRQTVDRPAGKLPFDG